MGRVPEGEHALTGAERQARYRARQAMDMAAPPPAQPPRKPRRVSRIERWNAAISELLSLQVEYAGWLEALAEATRDSPTGQALQAIVDLDLDEIAAIQPPRGYGRD
jgi:hypothetical protein